MPFLQENDGSGGAGDAIADRMGAIGLRAGPIMTDISFENGVGPLEILPIMLEPDPARTVIRPFDFAYPPSFASERGIR